MRLAASHPFSVAVLFAAIVAASLVCPADVEAQQPGAAASRTSVPKGYRRLGPGVETTIPPKVDSTDTVTQHDMVEIQSAGQELEWNPQTQSDRTTLKVLTKDIPFRRGVWYLEFTHKPLRIIEVDLPNPEGQLVRTKVWYLVYRVKNLGGHLKPEPAADGRVFENQQVDYPVEFTPQFVLESQQYKKAYLDRVLPLAVEAIEQREDPNRRLLDSVEISKTPIPVSKPGEDKSVWGVATWTDIDPRIGYFSIYVKGLTNAYRFIDPPGAYKPGSPPGSGRRIGQKTLKLNFWRPGDIYDADEREIYTGIPGQVDHEWVFR